MQQPVEVLRSKFPVYWDKICYMITPLPPKQHIHNPFFSEQAVLREQWYAASFSGDHCGWKGIHPVIFGARQHQGASQLSSPTPSQAACVSESALDCKCPCNCLNTLWRTRVICLGNFISSIRVFWFNCTVTVTPLLVYLVFTFLLLYFCYGILSVYSNRYTCHCACISGWRTLSLTGRHYQGLNKHFNKMRKYTQEQLQCFSSSHSRMRSLTLLNLLLNYRLQISSKSLVSLLCSE